MAWWFTVLYKRLLEKLISGPQRFWHLDSLDLGGLRRCCTKVSKACLWPCWPLLWGCPLRAMAPPPPLSPRVTS